MSAKKVTPVESGFSSPVVANDTESETSFAMRTANDSLFETVGYHETILRAKIGERRSQFVNRFKYLLPCQSLHIGKAVPIAARPR